ncbi:MAG: 3-oxoacyl-ACP synthase, partial [Candidatus Muiribacteriota bacterium]
MFGVKISGMGSYLPLNEVSNADMEKIVDTTDEWITSRSGIKSRRFAAEDEASSDMAYKAALKALEKSGTKPEELDMIIVGTY